MEKCTFGHQIREQSLNDKHTRASFIYHETYRSAFLSTLPNEYNKLRGITAFWREENHTACLCFYFDGPVSDEDIEDASDLATGIISHFSNSFVEEEYFRFDYTQPLPEESSF